MSTQGVIVDRSTLRFERVLPGPIDRVWSYLTDGEKRGTWLAAGEMDLRVGGKVEHVFNNAKLTKNADDTPPAKYAEYAGESRMQGVITAIDPPHLLAYTWSEPSGESEVTFELSPQGSKVKLVLTHRRIATREDLVGAAGGWHTHLDILVDRLEGREPPRFWATHMAHEAEYEAQVPA